jgi:hypothetical protein
MNDRQLMQTIFSAWHLAIAGAVEGTAVPAELVAALVANESGGNANAKRFEPAVFGHLCEVLAGKRSLYAPAGISRPLALADLSLFVVGDRTKSADQIIAAAGTIDEFFKQAMQRVAELATSFGLVQIMGWHWIEFNRPASTRPEDQLTFAAVLLVYFANKYGLDFAHASDASKFFSCWNTGEPGGHTYDPAYIPNGLGRMALYREIALAQTVTTT